MKIAIIDTRINKDFLTEKSRITHLKIIKNKVIPDKSCNLIRHGTICSYLLEQFINSNYELYSLNIWLDDETNASVKNFATALKWCRLNNINFICCSIGTVKIDDFQCIKKEIDKLYKKDIIVLAAKNNYDIYSRIRSKL